MEGNERYQSLSLFFSNLISWVKFLKNSYPLHVHIDEPPKLPPAIWHGLITTYGVCMCLSDTGHYDIT